MVDIIEEAKEEARLEAIQNFIQKHAALIAGSVLAFFVIFAGFTYYSNYSQTKAEKSAESFVQTLESLGALSPEEQQKKLAPLFLDKGYGDLAKLIASQIQMGGQQNAQSVGNFINDRTIDKNLKQFLIIGLGYGMLNKGIDLEAVVPALEEMVRANSFLKGFAQEILGLWHIHKKEYQKAHALFETLSKDGVVSEQTRSRADIYKRQLECEDKC